MRIKDNIICENNGIVKKLAPSDIGSLYSSLIAKPASTVEEHSLRNFSREQTVVRNSP